MVSGAVLDGAVVDVDDIVVMFVDTAFIDMIEQGIAAESKQIAG